MDLTDIIYSNDYINILIQNYVAQSERVKLKKRQEKLTAQLDEINAYEEKVHHLADRMMDIDLDDGVKVNYAKFAEILEKIK